VEKLMNDPLSVIATRTTA